MFYSDNPVRDAEYWIANQDKEEMDHKVGSCDHCGDTIFGYEAYYDFNGEMIHEDCLYAWAEGYRRR